MQGYTKITTNSTAPLSHYTMLQWLTKLLLSNYFPPQETVHFRHSKQAQDNENQ